MPVSSHYDPPATVLSDPFTGKPTSVAVRVFNDGIFILDEQGEALVAVEATTDATGCPEVVIYAADPSAEPNASGHRWRVQRLPGRATPDV